MKLSTDRSDSNYVRDPGNMNSEFDSVFNQRQSRFVMDRNIDWKFLNMPWSQSALRNQKATCFRGSTQSRPYPEVSVITSPTIDLNNGRDINEQKISRMKESKTLLNEMMQELPGSFEEFCQDGVKKCWMGCTDRNSYEETANLSRILWESQSVKLKTTRGLQPLTVSRKISIYDNDL